MTNTWVGILMMAQSTFAAKTEMEVLTAHQLILPKVIGESYTISQIKVSPKGEVGFWLMHSVGGQVASTKTLPKDLYVTLKESFERLPFTTSEQCQRQISVQIMEKKKNSVKTLCRDQENADRAYNDLANELTRLGRL